MCVSSAMSTPVATGCRTPASFNRYRDGIITPLLAIAPAIRAIATGVEVSVLCPQANPENGLRYRFFVPCNRGLLYARRSWFNTSFCQKASSSDVFSLFNDGAKSYPPRWLIFIPVAWYKVASRSSRLFSLAIHIKNILLEFTIASCIST